MWENDELTSEARRVRQKTKWEKSVHFDTYDPATARGDSMLEMILIMAVVGTALIGGTVMLFEWRTLVEYLQKR
ncbi:hypothetical protein I6F33_33020 [Bradyrhizobium sp. BRP20]|uniref:hypothetical protein n=1 Tax=Bradyrhizobium sp. BRP20 TaxID=2793822 RepID=UPI001CD1AD3D|nr:hypothetical protein [Bradyrhizobium sp. BRP20]MCA1437750.1 hypothetical protein [Bradyrhizobium sp. BRP20]